MPTSGVLNGGFIFGGSPVKLKINARQVELSDDYEDGNLLWALRDGAGLSGTKYGCGIGICGSCTVHIDGQPARSCMTPVAEVTASEITTIEGMLSDNAELHPVQQAFIDEQAPQCAWCMNGQIMTASAFLRDNPAPSSEEIINAMSGNYCRCGCYVRIRAAVGKAAELLKESVDV